MLHLSFGHAWPGGRDPFSRAAQARLMRLMPAARPKLSIQRALAYRIITHCLPRGDRTLTMFGVLCALEYLFALRVPSGLLQQGSLTILHVAKDCIKYGPIRRKGGSVQSVLRRQCSCRSKFKGLCARLWQPHLARICAHSREAFQMFTPQSFNTTLRSVLRQLGLPESAVNFHSSHDTTFAEGARKTS